MWKPRMLGLVVVAVLSAGGNSLSAAEVDADVAKWMARLGAADDQEFEALRELIPLGAKAVGPLRKLVLDKNETTIRRWQAAKALGAIGDKSAIGDLLQVLEETEDSTTVVRTVAVEALLRLRDEATTRKLMEMARNPTTPESRKPAVQLSLDPKFNALAESVWEKQFQWSESHPDALARARQEGKLVMTIVYANENVPPVAGRLDPSALPYQILIRGPLTDPDVQALTKNHFVTRKVATHIHAFSKDLPRRWPDPLAELQTNSRQTQPPAILFHTADGKLVRRINAIGVFNPKVLHAAMTTVLKESNQTIRGIDLVDLPEAIPPELHDQWVAAKLRYLAGDSQTAIDTIEQVLASSDDANVTAVFKSLVGKILHHDGRKTDARRWLTEAIESGLDGRELGETWYWLLDCDLSPSEGKHLTAHAAALNEQIVDSIWAAKIRLRFPSAKVHITGAESFDAPESIVQVFADGARHIELEQAVPRALQFLVRSQSRYGDWRPLSSDYQLFSRPAVTAICGTAIDAWLSDDAGVTLTSELKSELSRSKIATRKSVERYVEAVAQLEEKNYPQLWNQTYMLEYTLRLLDHDAEDKELAGQAQQLVDVLLDHQYEEGGWSYIPPTSAQRWGGIRPHSFNTAPILIELVKARRLGLRVDDAAIDRAMESLKSVRTSDGTFAYAPASGFAWMTKKRCAIARDCLCELALAAGGENNNDATVDALRRFHTHRADLEIPRKLYASYFNQNGHGSYFYAFGYFYASQALQQLENDDRLDVARDIQTDLLASVESDGTWIDNHAQGKAYATAMVLRTLHNTAKQIKRVAQ